MTRSRILGGKTLGSGVSQSWVLTPACAFGSGILGKEVGYSSGAPL